MNRPTRSEREGQGRSIAFVCLGDWDSTHCVRARAIGKYLQQANWKVNYAIPLESSKSTDDDVELFQISSSPLRFTLELRSWLKQNRPDYVHFLNPEVKAAMIGMSMRHLKIIGDWEDWHAVARDKGLRKIATCFADRFMMRRADLIMVASQWLSQQFQHAGRQDATYIPYACLPREFPNLPNVFSRPTIVYMGNLPLNGDHDILLDAAKLLRARGTSAPIYIVGHGPDLARCQQFAADESLHDLKFAGHLPWDEMLNCLQSAAALVFPIRENVSNLARCPFKIFQYAQAKRPIITNRVGEVPSILGDRATYVDCSATGFADAIQNLLVAAQFPEVDYGIEQHSWQRRTETFLAMVEAFERRSLISV